MANRIRRKGKMMARHPIAVGMIARFSTDEMDGDDLGIAAPFADLAHQLILDPKIDGPAAVEALRLLLAARDAALRALPTCPQLVVVR